MDQQLLFWVSLVERMKLQKDIHNSIQILSKKRESCQWYQLFHENNVEDRRHKYYLKIVAHL